CEDDAKRSPCNVNLTIDNNTSIPRQQLLIGHSSRRWYEQVERPHPIQSPAAYGPEGLERSAMPQTPFSRVIPPYCISHATYSGTRTCCITLTRTQKNTPCAVNALVWVCP
ncbi:unnamed protein product, partial [Ascophyllum nodosum]